MNQADRDLTASRAAWALFGAAAAISVALLLWLNRGTTFFVDEMIWFAGLADYTGPDSVLLPHNSHLHGTTRTVYFAIMELFGTEYGIVRVLGVVAVVACAALFFAYAKRRVGPVVALVPAVLLLFYGSAWQHVVGPIGFTVVGSTALGVATLLALDRGDRRGDLIACACLTLSTFTFTVGLAFIIGVAVWVLIGPDRRRRAWIFLVPLALYTIWWLWALQFDQGRTTWKDPLFVLEYFGQSLAVITGALTGVNVPFSRFGEPRGISEAPASALGWVVAALFLAALVWRISRGNVPRGLWAGVGVTLTYWLAGAIADPLWFGSQADAIRYVYPGSIGILLIAVEMASGLRFSRPAFAALFAVGAFSLAMNLVFLFDGADYLRAQSKQVKAELAALELAAGLEPGSDDPDPESVSTAHLAERPDFLGFGPDRDDYLESVTRYGSPADDLDELRAQEPAVRGMADSALVQAYELDLAPAPNPPKRSDCRQADGGTNGRLVPVPDGQLTLRALAPPQYALGIARFSPGVPLEPPLTRSWQVLELPSDGAEEPWQLAIPPGAVLAVCAKQPELIGSA